MAAPPPRRPSAATPAPPPTLATDPRVRTFLCCVAGWLVVKMVFDAHLLAQCVGSVVVFGFVALLVQTVGFQWQPFFVGLVSLPTALRLGELLLGSAAHDLVVLTLLAMFFTKPPKESFDGRPTREMRELQREMRQREQEASGRPPPPPPSEPTTGSAFVDRMFKQGKALVKDALTDIQDANVPIEFKDLWLVWLVSAKFSERPEDNVYYLGTFGRWFNVNRSVLSALLALNHTASSIQAQAAEAQQAPPPAPPSGGRRLGRS